MGQLPLLISTALHLTALQVDSITVTRAQPLGIEQFLPLISCALHRKELQLDSDTFR